MILSVNGPLGLNVSEPGLTAAWLGPEARRVKGHDVTIAAPPPLAYRAVLDLPLADLLLTRVLFTLRGIRYHRDMTVLDLFTTRPFRLLEEHAPWEIVFETARPRFRAVANFRVEPRGDRSRLTTATWVETWGWQASLAFRAYWLVVGPFSGLIRREMQRAAKRRAERRA